MYKRKENIGKIASTKLYEKIFCVSTANKNRINS